MSRDCLEFRRVAGADPRRLAPELRAHQQTCPACAEFLRRQLALNRKLNAALEVAVPAELPARAIWRQTASRRPARRFAIAAGLMLAVAAGFATLFFADPRPLPAAVIAHIEHEPDLLAFTTTRATPVQVSAVLRRGGAELQSPLGDVRHAGLCPFRGRLVPHLVVDVNGEPVSVLLLRGERVDGAQPIATGEYRGMILPHGDGSLAIVGAREDLIVPVRQRLEAAVRWTL